MEAVVISGPLQQVGLQLRILIVLGWLPHLVDSLRIQDNLLHLRRQTSCLLVLVLLLRIMRLPLGIGTILLLRLRLRFLRLVKWYLRQVYY